MNENLSFINKRSWVEINLNALRNNYIVFKNLQPKEREIIAVVKADAYGHGDREVVSALSSIGVSHFAVSNIDEALHIRSVSNAEILILGYTPIDMAEVLVKNNLTQTLLSEEYAEGLLKNGLPIKCQFAIDTGMRRIGLNIDNIDECERIIRKFKSYLSGIFTHLCVADDTDQTDFTKEQIKKFEILNRRIADLNLCCHCLNSAGGLWHNSNTDFARLGIVLYGLKPDYNNTLPAGITPVLSWKSVVAMVKNVNPGDTIGYGRNYIVNKPMLVATIPTGYADGYSRILSNRGYVLINGKKAPVLGKICMDQMMVDVSEVDSVDIGTEVVLIGKCGSEEITADELAHLCGTIGYEIVCGINKRVQRIYY